MAQVYGDAENESSEDQEGPDSGFSEHAVTITKTWPQVQVYPKDNGKELHAFKDRT